VVYQTPSAIPEPAAWILVRSIDRHRRRRLQRRGGITGGDLPQVWKA
jgi:hypothetical protein